MDKIRVLFLFPEFPLDEPITGGEIYNAVVIRATLANPAFDAQMIPRPQRLPALIRRISPLRRIWYQIVSTVAVLSRPCDLLVSDASYHSLCLGAMCAFWLLKRRPVVAMGHHLRYPVSHRKGLARGAERLAERLFYRCSSHIIPTSQTTADHFRQEGLDHATIEVIYPAISFELQPEPVVAAWRRDRMASGKLHLLFVGQCYERKGIHDLLEACAKLDIDWQLDIVGSYDPSSAYVQRLDTLVEEHDLGNHVRFHGFVSSEELVEAYRRADVFCLPSLHEGFGIVIAEAMAMGLPIVGTTAGAIPELVQSEESGLLVPPANPPALADALLRIASSPELYERLAIGAYARAGELARSWDNVAQDSLDAFESWSAEPLSRSLE